MDKETLSNYGWVVICVMILAVMIALATPFGSFVAGAVKSTTAGLFMTNQNALGAAGIIIGDNQFEDTDTPSGPVKNEHGFYYNKLYWGLTESNPQARHIMFEMVTMFVENDAGNPCVITFDMTNNGSWIPNKIKEMREENGVWYDTDNYSYTFYEDGKEFDYRTSPTFGGTLYVQDDMIANPVTLETEYTSEDTTYIFHSNNTVTVKSNGPEEIKNVTWKNNLMCEIEGLGTYYLELNGLTIKKAS